MTPEEAVQGIETRLETLEAGFKQSFATATTIEELNIARVSLLGSESPLTEALKLMLNAPPERRVSLGDRINRLHRDVMEGYRVRTVELDPRSGELP